MIHWLEDTINPFMEMSLNSWLTVILFFIIESTLIGLFIIAWTKI